MELYLEIKRLLNWLCSLTADILLQCIYSYVMDIILFVAILGLGLPAR